MHMHMHMVGGEPPSMSGGGATKPPKRLFHMHISICIYMCHLDQPRLEPPRTYYALTVNVSSSSSSSTSFFLLTPSTCHAQSPGGGGAARASETTHVLVSLASVCNCLGRMLAGAGSNLANPYPYPYPYAYPSFLPVPFTLTLTLTIYPYP